MSGGPGWGNINYKDGRGPGPQLGLPIVQVQNTALALEQHEENTPKTPNNNDLTAIQVPMAQGQTTPVAINSLDAPNSEDLPTDETPNNSTMGTKSNDPPQTEFDEYAKPSIKKVLPDDTDLDPDAETQTADNADNADTKAGGSAATEAQRPKRSDQSAATETHQKTIKTKANKEHPQKIQETKESLQKIAQKEKNLQKNINNTYKYIYALFAILKNG